MTREDIKSLMQNGKIDQAALACEAILREHPDDLEVKLLYGTCRQLLGDTATFQRIHDELAPTLDPLEGNGDTSCLVDQWRNYKKALRYLTAAGLVFAASAFLCGCYGVPQYDARQGDADLPLATQQPTPSSPVVSDGPSSQQAPAADGGR